MYNDKGRISRTKTVGKKSRFNTGRPDVRGKGDRHNEITAPITENRALLAHVAWMQKRERARPILMRRLRR